MSLLDNFDGWRKFLGDRLQYAEQGGMSEGPINEIATNVDPKK